MTYIGESQLSEPVESNECDVFDCSFTLFTSDYNSRVSMGYSSPV